MDLNQYREEINGIDQELMLLLKKSMGVCLQIGQYKMENGLPVVQPERFHELQETWAQKAKELGLGLEFGREMFRVIHDESVRLQESLADVECPAIKKFNS